MVTCLPAGREQQEFTLMYIYAIFNQEHRRIYVGMSKDPASRLKMHNLGMTTSTRPFRPWVLVFAQEFEKSEARKQEKYFKSGYGKEIIREIIQLQGP